MSRETASVTFSPLSMNGNATICSRLELQVSPRGLLMSTLCPEFAFGAFSMGGNYRFQAGNIDVR